MNIAHGARAAMTPSKRCLRNSTGLTPRAYVMRQRLCEAEYLVALCTLPRPGYRAVLAGIVKRTISLAIT